LVFHPSLQQFPLSSIGRRYMQGTTNYLLVNTLF
jgi:hypothetical protein